jgi:peptidylprolyl isomerase
MSGKLKVSIAVVAGAIFGFSAAAIAQSSSKPATPPPPMATPRQAIPQRPAASSETARVAETPAKDSEVIARVGASDVTADDVKAHIALLDAQQRAALARDPALLSQIVRGMLANRLVLKEALAKKWNEQPRVVAQLERARENLIVETYLQSVAVPPDNFPSEAEIKAVYDSNASAFVVPRKFRIGQIFVALGKDADKAATDKANKKLEDVQKKLKQGGEFAAVARSDSDDNDSAARDGEIGWLTEAELRPEIRSQIVGLGLSAVTEPIRLDDGWHIIKLLETIASHTRPLAEVRDTLVQRIRAERTDANRRAYIAELLKQNPAAINEIALSKLIDPKSGQTPTR